MRETSRRCKLIPIGIPEIMTLLGKWRDRDCISLPVLTGIPDDARICGVHHDFSRDTFLIQVEHPSFPEIAPGSEYLWMDLEYECVDLRLMTRPPPVPLPGLEATPAAQAMPIVKSKGWEFLGAPR